MIIGSAPVLILLPVVVVVARPPRCHLQLIQQSRSIREEEQEFIGEELINLIEVDVWFVLQMKRLDRGSDERSRKEEGKLLVAVKAKLT